MILTVLRMTNYKNFFTFSSSVQDLLFKDVSVSTNDGMFGLCVGVAVFTFLYEAVKALRHYLVILQMHRTDNPNISLPDSSNASPNNLFSWLNTSSQKLLDRLKFHCLQTILHMFQLCMGYMIMLIIMSYNAWFLVTVIVVTAVCFYFHEFVLSRKSMILPVEIPSTNL